MYVHDMICHLQKRAWTQLQIPPSQYANALSRAVFHANAFHRIFSNVIYMTAVAQASIMF